MLRWSKKVRSLVRSVWEISEFVNEECHAPTDDKRSSGRMKTPIDDLLRDLRGCQLCAEHLALGPRPVVQASARARLLVASQAPGSKVHRSGIPFSDESGRRLRHWTGLSEEAFYDPARVAIVPMGFCYPGRGAGGDAPPRPECAPRWRRRLLGHLAEVRLTLLVGSYAQVAALGPGRTGDRVRDFETYLPEYFPLPHPSWRSRLWAAQNPWFEAEVLPALRTEVRRALGDNG